MNGSLFTFGYDNDGYLTQAEQLTLTRDPANGLLTGTTLDGVTTTQAYNAFAEMTAFTANDGASDVYQVAYSHDVIGRITQKVETIVGTTTTYDYDKSGGWFGGGRLGFGLGGGASLDVFDNGPKERPLKSHPYGEVDDSLSACDSGTSVGTYYRENPGIFYIQFSFNALLGIIISLYFYLNKSVIQYYRS